MNTETVRNTETIGSHESRAFLRRIGRTASLLFLMLCVFGALSISVAAATVTDQTSAHDSFGNAQAVGENDTILGNISKKDDMYKFTISKRGRFRFHFTHERDLDDATNGYTVFLYGPKGDSDTERYVAHSCRNNDKGIYSEYLGLAPATYYLCVRNHQNGGRSQLDYTLQLSFAEKTCWETEFNDSFGTADAVGLGQTIYGALMDGYDTDYYQFKIQKEGVVSLKLTHNSNIDDENKGWYMCLYDSKKEDVPDKNGSYGDSVSCGDDTGCVRTTGIIPAGIYYAKIYGANGRTYGLEVTYTDPYAIPKPVISSVTNVSNGVKVIWKAATRATSYEVWKQVGSGEWTKLTTTSSLTCLDKKATVNGKVYKYKIYGVSSKRKSPASAAKSTFYLTRPAITGLHSAQKSVKVAWGKNSMAAGYKVQLSLSSKFSSLVGNYTVTGNANLTKTAVNLSRNKQYYVRVAAYKGSYTSTWSVVKSITTK